MTNTTINELWVAEYSLSQNAFHVQQVEEATMRNLGMILQKSTNDYLMIGLANTHHEASAICDVLRKKLDEGTNG